MITSMDPLRIYVFEGDVLLRFCPEKYHPFDAANRDKYVVHDDYRPTWKVKMNDIQGVPSCVRPIGWIDLKFGGYTDCLMGELAGILGRMDENPKFKSNQPRSQTRGHPVARSFIRCEKNQSHTI